MATFWFVIVALMLVAYVVLDGFDLGVGIVHYLVGKTPQERRLLLSTIGPVWDGNEVCLLAAGGTLYFAFPLLYASSFSGFYLPLMIVLWLLMLRAIGIELRSHFEHPLWWSFFDFTFALSSLLLAIFFGAALGNVIRGVPLNAEGYFFTPLWTTFTVTAQPGILDWYTVLTGLLALAALSSHGALYLATKTADIVQERARTVASRVWWLVVVLSGLSLLATLKLRPALLSNYRHPLGWLIPLLVAAALGGMFYFRQRGYDKAAFISSCLYLIGMLGGVAYGTFPTLLYASTNEALSLTIYNAAAPEYGLTIGRIWWLIGITLAIGYFVYVYRSFRGKVSFFDLENH
ncbi:MAG: cytochrome d ubiquinol oxidase subunit II [Acidobacteria bacterium]|nr:cytochrome d ubiquinol oxidase subunit II [Acidobacteriota bacterium]